MQAILGGNSTVRKRTEIDGLSRTKIIILVWIASLTLLSIYSYSKVSGQIRSNLGNKAMFAAISVSNELEMDDEEYESIMDMDFEDALNTTKNLEFESKSRKYMESTDIKYIYVESLVPKDKLKYRVEPGEEEDFGVKAGTSLGAMYLLDAVKSEAIREEDTGGQGYSDKDRYDVLYPEFEKIYIEGKPTYTVSDGKWGSYVTGYAPFYTKGGKYVGMVGADIYIEKYYRELGVFLKILSGFVVINIIAGGIILKSSISLRTTRNFAYKIEDHYSTDYLTSVLSREKFLDKLGSIWSTVEGNKNEIGVFMLDIDHFKNYNDNYGHIYGDEAIKAVCREVKTKVEEHGGFMGRFGGDEFLIAFEGMAYPKMSEVADEIVRRVEKLGYKHEYSGVSDVVTVSLGGVSLDSEACISMESAMERADIALYRAKKHGRNRALVLKID